MELRPYLEDRRQKVDRFLDRHLSEKNFRFKELLEAMRYSLLAGGKRVRPILTIAAAEAVAGESAGERAIPIGCSLEMIHTYSLIHDDLPAMDDDDLRRGRPTNHKVYGEAMAILAGDSLLSEAFAVMAGAQDIPPTVLVEIMGDIARASGAQGMAGGQALDLQCEHRKIQREELETLHRHKTGCLIEVSVMSGSKVAGACEKDLVAIHRYGDAIGLAFQIADDILDVEGGTEELGKATGGDARKEKSTYPSTIGMEESKRLASELVERALESLKGFGNSADPLREIARYIVSRKS